MQRMQASAASALCCVVGCVVLCCVGLGLVWLNWFAPALCASSRTPLCAGLCLGRPSWRGYFNYQRASHLLAAALCSCAACLRALCRLVNSGLARLARPTMTARRLQTQWAAHWAGQRQPGRPLELRAQGRAACGRRPQPAAGAPHAKSGPARGHYSFNQQI